MCGFVGVIDYSGPVDPGLLEKMNKTQNHRGPDGCGLRLFKFSEASVGLAHTRLSILDLREAAGQPMSCGSAHLVYNGEIYNFKELRKELEESGNSFQTDGDTEVLLNGLAQRGPDFLNSCIGMFAGAYFNESEGSLFLFRDRAGVKPLYYYESQDLVLFGSELKSLMAHPRFDKSINQDALAMYLQYGYIHQPSSIFKKVKKLLPGNFLKIDLKTRKVEITSYWDAIDCYNGKKLDLGYAEAKSRLHEILKSACMYRMVSDVPVGVFLSGGYDSSLVAAIIQNQVSQKLKTFTIGFDNEQFNEAKHARKVAQSLGTDHTEYYCTQKDALEIIPRLAHIYDEPFGDSSAIPTTLVSQLARKSVTVALSADAGDELFAGYYKHHICMDYYSRVAVIPSPVRNVLGKAMNLINPSWIPVLSKGYNFSTRWRKASNVLTSRNVVDALQFTSQHFPAQELSTFLNYSPRELESSFQEENRFNSANDQLSRVLGIDYKTYLPGDILTKVDRATMSVSLEGREPLLDHRILEFAARLPSEFKYNSGEKKFILKDIVHDYLSPEIMDRPKMGFGIPIVDWFREELKDMLTDYLSPDRLSREGFFQVDAVLKLRDSYLNGHAENVQKLWFLLMFEMWHEAWMN